MSHHTPNRPTDRLPSAAELHAYIGHLLRELRIARRAFRLAKTAEAARQDEKAVSRVG